MENREIVYKNVADLIPYARNSRTHDKDQVSQIVASIKEFGFTNPVLIDDEGLIIAGHGRVQAAQKLNLKTVPTICLDYLTEAQKKAYVIADNRLALNAGWDFDMLKVELNDLNDLDFDVSLLGFEDKEINDILADPTEGLVDEDSTPDLVEDPITVEGDIWLLGNHRLMCGDSTSIDAVDKLMDGKKADMVFTDPPYGVDYKGVNNDSRDGLEELLRDVFTNYITVLKSGAPCYVFHSDRCADIFHRVFRDFFHFSSMIIWFKNTLTLSQTDYQSQHEPCMYGWNKNGTHKFYGDRKQVSVWQDNKEKFTGHTTNKPVNFIIRAIKNSSSVADIVLDLFGGSGATLIAAEKSARKCYMMELDPVYVDVIVKRWEDFTGQNAVHLDSNKTYNELINDINDG